MKRSTLLVSLCLLLLSFLGMLFAKEENTATVNPLQWRSQFEQIAGKMQKNVVPGIDAVVSGSDRYMKFVFIVQPRQNLQNLHFDLSEFSLQKKQETAEKRHSISDFLLFQTLDGKESAIEGDFDLTEDGTFRIHPGEYDVTQPLLVTFKANFNSQKTVRVAAQKSGGTDKVQSAAMSSTMTDQVVGGGSEVQAGGKIRYHVETTNSGSSSATNVTFDITAGTNSNIDPASLTFTPIAIDDGGYSTVAGINLNVPDGATDLLNNDNPGQPAGTLTSFGGGSVGGTVTTNVAGSTVPLGTGSLTVNADGTFSLTPDLGFSGPFTFEYRVTNTLGSSDGLATVNVTAAVLPAADPDSLYTQSGMEITSANITNDDVLGTPAATVTHFGGGSLGGTVTDNAAGSSVSFAGGTLTVNANGNVTLTGTPLTVGQFYFNYRITSALGTSDANVTVFISTADVAPYVTGISPTNAATGVSITPTVTVTFSEPVYFSGAGATLVGSTSGSHILSSAFNSSTEVTFSLAAYSSPLAYNETVTFTVIATDVYDQDLVDPPNYMAANFVSTFTTVAPPPVANNDSYNSIGNVGITVTPANGVLANDAGTPAPTVVAAAGGTTNGGAFSIGADGGFSYLPAVGFEGTDQFTYTAQNSGGTAVGTVTLTVSGMIWFIDNTAASPGSGNLSSPFNTLAAFSGLNNGAENNPAAGDNIFIYSGSGSYTGGVALLNNQKLIGQGASASLASITGLTVPAYSNTLPATSGTRPVLDNAAIGVTVVENNTLRGFDIGNTSAGGAGIANVPQNVSFGTLTVNDMAIGGTGRAMLLLGHGTLAVTLNNLTSSADANGLGVLGTSGVIGGNFTVSGATTISNTTVIGINISNSSATFDFGATSLTGIPATGVNLENNANASFTFDALNITTTNGVGLKANNSGTVTVAGNANTLNTPGFSAVDMLNTTISSSGMTFQSINSNGGTTPGIVLNNTGSTGFFTVTGDGVSASKGGNNSGGIIQNKTGANGTTNNDGTAITVGVGALLVNAHNVTLNRMRFNDNSNFAIFGNNVTNFTLQYSRVNGVNGDDAGQDEGSMRFVNLLGSSLIHQSIITGGLEDNLRIDNKTGTLNRLTVTNSYFHNNSVASGNDGILIETENSAVVNVTVDSCNFAAHRGDHFDFSGTGSSSNDVIFTRNIMTGGHSNALGQSLMMSNSNSATTTYDISNNTISGAILSAFTLFQGATSTNSANFTGTFNNNVVGTSGVNGSGSSQGNGVAITATGLGTMGVNLTNNTVRQWSNGHGIVLTAGDTSPILNTNITGNLITEPNLTSFPANGLHINAGTTSTGAANVCANIQNNSMVGSGNSAQFYDDFRLRQRNSSTVNLPGYGGAATDNAAVVSFIQGQNTGSPTGSASNTGNFTGTGSSCL